MELKVYAVTYETDAGPEVTFETKAYDKQDIIAQHNFLMESDHFDPWPIVSIEEVESC